MEVAGSGGNGGFNGVLSPRFFQSLPLGSLPELQEKDFAVQSPKDKKYFV